MEEVGSGLPSGLSGGVSGAGGVRGGAWASSGGAREPERPLRLDLLLDMPPACGDLQGRHAWNPEDRSLNIFVKDDDRLTFHRHPVAQSTDCIRGKVGQARPTSSGRRGLSAGFFYVAVRRPPWSRYFLRSSGTCV